MIAYIFAALATLVPTPAPTAAPCPVTETYFGTQVTDPYRCLEKLDDAAVQAFMKNQAAFTNAILARIPGRAALIARVKELDNAGASVPSVQISAGRYFYERIEPGSDNRKLYVRDGLRGAERLLVDTEKLTAGGKHYSIDYYTPSLDGKYVAAGISAGGSENSVIHVFDATSTRELPDAIDRAQFGGVVWRDARTFYYTRLPKLPAGAPDTARYQKARVFVHTLGAQPDADKAIFGYGVSPRVAVAPDDFSFVGVWPTSKWAVGVVAHGVQNEQTMYVAPAASLGKTGTPWRKLVDVPDAVTGFDVHGDTAYLLTHKDASRFKVLALDLRRTIASATTVVGPSERVIVGVGAAADALYVQQMEGGLSKLLRLPYGAKAPQEVALPFDGSISGIVTDTRYPGVIFSLTSWTRSSLWYAYDPSTNTVADTKLKAPSPVDFSAVTSTEVKAPSADGTLVPLSIIYPKNIVLDGSHPTILEGYGAYGISITPRFTPIDLALLERGGVVAFCHPRGGGEYGEDWHRGGMLLTKQHTIDDMIACANYLIANKYTSPAKLAGAGTSAGGITIGGAITQRPELFAVAFIRVGDSDSLRSETMPSGPANIPEFGTVKDANGFKALLAMDAYQHVRDGVKYPAVMLTTGANDPRVAPWQALKMAARLQAASTSGKPVLLRVDYDAGHGLGSTKTQADAEFADRLSFLLWQTGDPQFQPAQQ